MTAGSRDNSGDDAVAAISAAWLRRLPAYLYLRDIVAGKRVLEVGCGDGLGAAFLADHGAAQVVGIDSDAALLERGRRSRRRSNLELRRERATAIELEDASFDVVVVPRAATVVRHDAALGELRRLLAPGGWLIAIAPSADRPRAPAGGLSYHDLVARLDRRFGPVRVIAQLPLVAMALVEYGATASDAALDVSLASDAADAVADYIALCGGGIADALGLAARARGLVVVELPLRAGLEAIAEGMAATAMPAASALASATTTASEQIAAALARHVDEVRDLEAALGERDELVAELEAELVALRAGQDEQQEKIARATANWREAESKKDDVWRRVGDLQAELDKHREETIARAAKVRRDHQLELARAVEDAGQKHLIAKTLLARAEQERDRLQEELAAHRREPTAATGPRDDVEREA